MLHFFDVLLGFGVENVEVFLVGFELLGEEGFVGDPDVLIEVVVGVFDLADGDDGLVVNLGEFPFRQHQL